MGGASLVPMKLEYDWTKKELEYEINLRKERIDAIEAEKEDRKREIERLVRMLEVYGD